MKPTARHPWRGSALGLLALSALGLPLAALLGMPPASAQEGKNVKEVYTCVDKNGRRLTSDRPIIECLDREQRVLDATGTERRRIGPTLTEHERAALEEQRRREAQERARIAEERRRERALVARYPDEASHQSERAQTLAQLDVVSEVARKRILALLEEKKRIGTELEFYGGKPTQAPVKLQRQLHDNEEGVREQQRFLSGQEQERQRVQQRFDAELAQLRQLWAAQRASAGQ